MGGVRGRLGRPGRGGDRFGQVGANEAGSIARVVKELGVPDEIIGRMLVIRSDEIFWLSADDLQAMGVTMTGKLGQAASEQPLAAFLPAQLAPSRKPAAPQSAAPGTWNDVVNAAFARSRGQNGGEPFTARQCGPVWTRFLNGSRYHVRTAIHARRSNPVSADA